jgi:hypothetical protein
MIAAGAERVRAQQVDGRLREKDRPLRRVDLSKARRVGPVEERADRLAVEDAAVLVDHRNNFNPRKLPVQPLFAELQMNIALTQPLAGGRRDAEQWTAVAAVSKFDRRCAEIIDERAVRVGDNIHRG